MTRIEKEYTLIFLKVMAALTLTSTLIGSALWLITTTTTGR